MELWLTMGWTRLSRESPQGGGEVFLGKMQVGEEDPGNEAEQNRKCMTSESARGIRVCLPMQGTWVQSLLQEDLPYLGATQPVGPNC